MMNKKKKDTAKHIAARVILIVIGIFAIAMASILVIK